MKFILLCIFLLFSLEAKVISHDSVGARLHDFSFIDFCTEMNAKSSTLISASSLNEIECFNQKFKISDFCIKKLPIDATFSRGFAVESEKKVYCEEAKAVSISLTCDSKIDICKHPRSSCEKLKKIYAERLDVAHAANVGQNLNCYYSLGPKDNVGEILNEI